MDLVMRTVSKMNAEDAGDKSHLFRELYGKVLENDEFRDLISKSVDHKSRTLRRVEIWDLELTAHLLR